METKVDAKLSDYLSLEDYNHFMPSGSKLDEKRFEMIDENLRFGFKTEHTYGGHTYTIYQFGEIIVVYDSDSNIVQVQDIYEGEGHSILNNGRILFQPGHDSCGFIYFDTLEKEEVYIR